jgi:hypothetical protein
MSSCRPVSIRNRYCVYGLAVESEQEFASIDIAGPEDRDAAPTIRIALREPEFFRARTAALSFNPDDWIKHAVLADGGVYVRAGDVFEATVSPDGSEARCAGIGDADLRAVEANLLNFVLSAALTLHGEEPLHSTVVEIGGKAIGLLGPSGAGKSTLAASLIARGGELVTDDMLRVTFDGQRPFAHAGPYRLKLFDEPARLLLPGAVAEGHFNAVSGKIMMRPRAPGRTGSRRAWPLAALFWIGDEPALGAERVTVEQLAGTDLAKVLLSSAMNIRYQAIDRLARQMAFAERLAGCVPVHRLRYPRRFEVADTVVDTIHRTVDA